MVQNPTVYIFFCAENTCEEILHQAKRTHQKGAFFHADTENINAVKARIQANEGGLNIKRVNIYAVVEANFLESANAYYNRLQAQFREAFTFIDATLVIILNESIDAGEPERQSTAKFLNSATPESRIYLLSNRNEHDEILPHSHTKICETIAALPLLKASRFNEVLAAKSKEQERAIFASAGFWQNPPPKLNESRALHKLVEILEGQMILESRDLKSKEERPKLFKKSLTKILTLKGEIDGVVTSVAAKPLRCWELWGQSVETAEKLLYGDEAEKFFQRVYGEANESPAFDDTKKTLRQAVATEKRLSGELDEITRNIHETQTSLTQAENLQIKFGKSVDYVKDRIGECYALRYELQNWQHVYSAVEAKHDRLNAYIQQFRSVIKNIKALPVEESCDETPSSNTLMAQFENAEIAEKLAPLAISLLRDDGLIRENHTLLNANNEPCILRLIGGFSLRDL